MHGNACISVFLADRFLVEFEQLYAELALEAKLAADGSEGSDSLPVTGGFCFRLSGPPDDGPSVVDRPGPGAGPWPPRCAEGIPANQQQQGCTQRHHGSHLESRDPGEQTLPDSWNAEAGKSPG